MNESPALVLHRQLKGKLKISSSYPLKTKDDLALLYTPGVADACVQIHQNPEEVWELTGRGNTVAVVSDGSAVLGLGNIGALAGLPVMEGKALLFYEFAKIHAIPIMIQSQDVSTICTVVENLALNFGGINLEDISAPRCFEVENNLQEKLNIPVFHDDQHGTAVVVLAALLNVSKYFQTHPQNLRIVVNGAGAAGTAITKLLLKAGFQNITVCDRDGILGEDYFDRDDHYGELARLSQPQPRRGSLEQALEGANVFIGVSRAGVLSREMVKKMHPQSAVFALANPTPEILPDELEKTPVVLSAFGRSGVYNQINNVLAFPGLFRGALDVRAKKISQKMQLNAARALADLVSEEELSQKKIIPSPFNNYVVPAVALATATSAIEENIAQKPLSLSELQNNLKSRFKEFEIIGISD